MPSSTARSMIGRLSPSPSAHPRQPCLPNGSVPRQRRETLSPVVPSRTYSIAKRSTRAGHRLALDFLHREVVIEDIFRDRKSLPDLFRRHHAHRHVRRAWIADKRRRMDVEHGTGLVTRDPRPVHLPSRNPDEIAGLHLETRLAYEQPHFAGGYVVDLVAFVLRRARMVPRAARHDHDARLRRVDDLRGSRARLAHIARNELGGHVFRTQQIGIFHLGSLLVVLL